MWKDLAEFFGSAKGFISSSIGSALIGWILSWPVYKEQLVIGTWKRCGGLGEPLCHVDYRSGVQTVRSVNVLGLNALADQSTTATGLGIVIGLICGFLAFVFGALAAGSSAA